jgi:DNA-binding response OmpR family regulator
VTTILVVDDSLTVRMDLTEALEAASLRTVPCATIAEARAALAREDVALVILDVNLPDGDGVELLSELRADPARADLPVVMLSSEAEIKDRIRGLTTGADDFVGKPYDTGFVVARARELARRHAAAPDRPTVLVVDDSPTYRDRLAHALEGAGYHVTTAPDGARGLAAANAQRPTAIVVDGVMPDLDGAALIRRIRLDPALRTTPCVLLTGSAGAGSELAALDAGADAFVRKEDDLDVILARIGSVVRAGAHAREAASMFGPKRVLAIGGLGAMADELRASGYDVVVGRAGHDALEMLAVQDVDCVLVEMDREGAETCRRIRASGPRRDLPLIVLAPDGDRAATLDGLAAGADDVIARGSPHELIEARVRAQIRRKRFEDEHRRAREQALRSELADELARKNKELEAFSYSVSHDLRAPLRSISGFSQTVLRDQADKLDERGRDYLRRVVAAAARMGELIDDLLQLSRVTRAELVRAHVDLGEVARAIVGEHARKEPGRAVGFDATGDLGVHADPRLIRVLLDNLVGNAWKFTAHAAAPRIEVGREGEAFFIRDNGAGFAMEYAGKLFAPFQRLHAETEFPGTGIGLSIAQRIVDRHGGRIWAEGEVGRGATIRFTLPAGGSP